jgi:hypothetical protein
LRAASWKIAVPLGREKAVFWGLEARLREVAKTATTLYSNTDDKPPQPAEAVSITEANCAEFAFSRKEPRRKP